MKDLCYYVLSIIMDSAAFNLMYKYIRLNACTKLPEINFKYSVAIMVLINFIFFTNLCGIGSNSTRETVLKKIGGVLVSVLTILVVEIIF